jgi:hypothetical protein
MDLLATNDLAKALRDSSLNETRALPPPLVVQEMRKAALEVDSVTGVCASVDAVACASVVIALACVVVLQCCVCCLISRLRRRTREKRENKLQVDIAKGVQEEDDSDEHEIEQHNHIRSAAPGDSDLDDDEGGCRRAT